MMKHRTLMILVMALAIAGCANQRNLYQWGNYEETLFVYFHEPAVKDEMLKNYFAFIEASQSEPKKLAPGLFAEAGTFMLERGNRDAAIRFYQLEHDSWAESRPLMATLIKNLEVQAQQSTETQSK